VLPPLILEDESKLGSLTRWVARYKPDVVISIGWAIYRWLVSNGFSVPEDLSFAQLSLDGKYKDIAGIDQKSPLLGATAVDLVIDQLFRNEYGIPERPKMVLLDGEWKSGPSAPAIRSR
jgi:LacI family transcriptional regulator